ncbi:MAG: hypothetical protein R2697_06030 [Ilumatobacteraceae bacterium]
MEETTIKRTPGVTVPAGLPDISDWEFWTGDRAARAEGFRVLRDTPGLVKFPEVVFGESPFEPGAGYYAVTRHEDVWHVSRHPELFCSSRGGVNIGDMPPGNSASSSGR